MQFLSEHPEVIATIIVAVLGSGGIGAVLSTVLSAWWTGRKADAEAEQIDAQTDKTRFETELAAICALQKQMAWQQEENARLRCEIDELKVKYHALEQEVTTLKQQRDEHAAGEKKLQSENEELRRENAHLGEQVRQLLKSNQDLQKSNTALRNRVKALERKVAELEEKYTEDARPAPEQEEGG